jgi:hypothetical protein
VCLLLRRLQQQVVDAGEGLREISQSGAVIDQ